jgi:serine/threonine protein kinase
MGEYDIESSVNTPITGDVPDLGRRAWKSASRAAKHMSKHSRIVNPKLEKQIPRFDEQEVVVGKLLGSGGFNHVYELERVELIANPLSSEHARKISSELQIASREHVAKHFYRESSQQGRYAIKFLSKETIQDPDRFCTGAADLVVEAKFLASLEHPNIVRLRGMAAAGTAGFSTCRQKGYFLLLDKLNCTLDDKIEEWKDIEKKAAGALQRKILDRNGKKQKNLLADRMHVAFDVASAIQYLHQNKIIYRDLKVRLRLEYDLSYSPSVDSSTFASCSRTILVLITEETSNCSTLVSRKNSMTP